MTPPSNKQTRKAADATARERAAAIKAQAEREERRRKLMIRGGIGLLVVAAVGGLTAIALNSSSGGGKTSTGLPKITSQGSESLPPWAAPTDTANHVEAAGLQVLPTEMLERHDHAHLDVYVDGKTTPVPAYLGIVGGATPTGLSSLHTHDATGIIHIEAPKGDRFTLGQLFNEWNVKLTPTQVGGLKTGDGKTLTIYVNGKPVTTDPTALELNQHQEIALVYGTAAENKTVKVPATYKWPSGL